MRTSKIPHTIRGKIVALFAISFLSVSILTLGSVWSLFVVRGRLVLSESYDDMLNSMLEVRRFEKNLLYFHDKESLQEQIAYLEKIEIQVGELAKDLAAVGGTPALRNFQDDLANYKLLAQSFHDNSAKDTALQGDAAAEAEQIRVLGKRMLGYVDGLLQAKRRRIHSAILRTSILPFAFLAVFLLLMVVLWQLLFRRILQPLKLVAESTRKVARGEFMPVPVENMVKDEIHGLLSALNSMAKELEMNQETILQSRKMSALGAFTAGVAHELNNPLNNISLTVQAFIEEYAEKLDNEATEMLNDIVAQSDRAADIVHDLLDFSRTESAAAKRLRINAVIRNAVSLLRNQLLISKVRLATDLAPDLPDISGNARNLEQTLMNLVLNAIQAMPDGGEIRLRSFLAQNDSTWVRVEICDTGPGIDPEHLGHIFDPFYTTKSVGQGTGLGLAVVYSMIKRHGGRIEAVNKPEGGACFIISLPPCPPEEESGP